MTTPEVTVLMTVYNGMPYWEAVVNSIPDQTLCDFKFVIVDNGSSDGTANFLKKLSDRRVTILSQENQGTAAAANYGLQVVETTYVERIDADDIAPPTRLEKQLQFMEKHPDVGIVGARIVPMGIRGAGKNFIYPSVTKRF